MPFLFSPSDAEIVLTVFLPFLLPFVVRFLKSDGYSRATNLLIAVFVAAVAGGVAAYAGGDLNDPKSVTVIAALIFAQTQAYYATWFQSVVEQKPTPAPTPTE